jgi:hypothetical protein
LPIAIVGADCVFGIGAAIIYSPILINNSIHLPP